MSAEKSVYKTAWTPSKSGAGTLVATVLVLVGLPYYFTVTVDIQGVRLIAGQIIVSLFAIFFFYEGISRLQQYRVALVLFSLTATLGLVANLAHQSVQLLGGQMIQLDAISYGLINLGAVAATLLLYRIKKVPAEREDSLPGSPGRLIPTPLAIPLAVLAIFLYAMQYAPYIFHIKKFSTTVGFFCWCQAGLIALYINTFFKRPTLEENYKTFLTLLSLIMLLGGFANLINQNTQLRPGFRIELECGEYMMMNLGALLCMLAYRAVKSYNQSVARADAAAAAVATGAQEPPEVSSGEVSPKEAPKETREEESAISSAVSTEIAPEAPEDEKKAVEAFPDEPQEDGGDKAKETRVEPEENGSDRHDSATASDTNTTSKSAKKKSKKGKQA
ncbi:MAG: hypothetical protein IPM23_01255 [Candidatus Melainabacteria bacterium]|nr:hypothetical protein [Candidatus Melainabacteria bacterium]